MRCFYFVLVLALSASRCHGQQQVIYQLPNIPFSANITLMTWNILAPIWVDRPALKARNVVDMDLLNDDVRIKLVVSEILDKMPDILVLQEVQEDTFAVLQNMLAFGYNSVGFAPNQNEYWKSYVPEGEEYVKNGVATFYKKRIFYLASQNTFQTSQSGSVASAAVLRSIIPGLWDRASPIIVLNCHLEAGFTEAESNARYAMGTLIMEEANRLYEENSGSHDPIVIIAGDINSQYPFPGYMNFISNGYLDALAEIGNPPTYFYEGPVQLPTGVTVIGSDIDHVFIRSSDKAEGRIRYASVALRDISSDDLSEVSYVGRLKKVVAKELLDARIGNVNEAISHLLNSSAFSTLFKLTHGGKEVSDENVNRVLRLGSDHLPVLVKMEIALN